MALGIKTHKYRRTSAAQQTTIDGMPVISTKGTVIWVDGTSGSNNNDGLSPTTAKATIQAGVTAAGAFGVVYVLPKLITDMTGDPTNYAETVIIPATHPNLSLVGVSHGRTQGGLPQIKMGSGSTAQLTIRAPGCYIANLGINGGSATGGGILLDDDNSTKSAFGTTIENCHFKNCVGSTATDASTGGAIQWTAAGNAWQVHIKGNRFYKCVGDVVLKGTSNTVPQDVVIEDNIFSGPAASVDCNLYLMGGSGINGLYINNNIFPALPAISSGAHVRFMKLTGCVGILSHNFFGTTTLTTFAAAGSMAFVPTTMFLAGNWGEGTALITRA